jgi:hypothetical protein
MSEQHQTQWTILDAAWPTLGTRGSPAQQHYLQLTIDTTSGPLPGSAYTETDAELTRRLNEVLADDATVSAYCALRANIDQAEREAQAAELRRKKLEARQQRIQLQALTPDTRAELEQVARDIAGEQHGHSSAIALATSMRQQLGQVEQEAGRVVHAAVSKIRMALVEEATRRRAEAIEQLCRIAGPALTELAHAIQSIRATSGIDTHLVPAQRARLLAGVQPRVAPVMPAAPPPPPPAQKVVSVQMQSDVAFDPALLQSLPPDMQLHIDLVPPPEPSKPPQQAEQEPVQDARRRPSEEPASEEPARGRRQPARATK